MICFRDTYFHIDVNNKSRDRDHTYSAQLASLNQKTLKSCIKCKKSNLTRLGFYVLASYERICPEHTQIKHFCMS